MSPILDLPDPEKGREIFEGLYGPERGRRRFRAVLRIFVPLAIIAAILFVLAQITSSGTTIYSGVRDWFSPQKAISKAQDAATPQPQSGCATAGIVDHGQGNEFRGKTIAGFDCGVDARGTGGHYEVDQIKRR